MKNAFATTAVILAAALTAGTGFAAIQQDNTTIGQESTSSALSREAVRAQYLEAVKVGNGPAAGESTNTGSQTVSSAPTRADVKAELQQAQKTGKLPATGDRG